MAFLWLVFAFLLGAICLHFARQHGLAGERLTKEEYSRCVQMILDDDELEAQSASKLIAELQNYMMDDEVPMSQLHIYNIHVITKVKNEF